MKSSPPQESWLKNAAIYIALIPVAVFFGWYACGLALVIRHYLRVPCLFNLVFIYAALIVPMWLMSPYGNAVSIIMSVVVMVCLILPALMGGMRGVMDGDNLETSAPAHMLLIVVYFNLWLNR
jgi:hypothetical protein